MDPLIRAAPAFHESDGMLLRTRETACPPSGLDGFLRRLLQGGDFDPEYRFPCGKFNFQGSVGDVFECVQPAALFGR